MHSKMRLIAWMIALLASAGTAQADRIAGWDFSQYATAGRLTIDGTTFINTLDANYTGVIPGASSFFDGYGTTAAPFGTMLMDGTLGSTSVSPNPPSVVQPTPRSVILGNTASFEGAIQGNASGFDVFGALSASGQANTEFLGLFAESASTVVFSADLSSLPDVASNWSVQFGGETLVGSSSVSVNLDVGCDGALDSGTTIVALDTTTGATQQTVVFPGANTSALACVRFALANGAVIDNVSIEATPVPEAGTILMLTAGVGGLVVFRRMKS